jgi:hypothetical protein
MGSAQFAFAPSEHARVHIETVRPFVVGWGRQARPPGSQPPSAKHGDP